METPVEEPQNIETEDKDSKDDDDENPEDTDYIIADGYELYDDDTMGCLTILVCLIGISSFLYWQLA